MASTSVFETADPSSILGRAFKFIMQDLILHNFL